MAIRALGRLGRGRSRRAVIAILDQVASSSSNLVVLLSVAHTGTSSEFGQFSILVIVHGVVLGCVRAGIGESTVLLAASLPTYRLHQVWSQAIIRSAAVGALLGAMFAVGALVSSSAGIVWCVGASLAVICVQDTIRYFALSQHRAEIALVLDGTWLAVQLLATAAVVQLVPNAGPAWYVVIWALSAGVSLCVALYGGRGEIDYRRAAQRVLATPMPTGRWRALLADYVLLSGMSQLGLLALGGIVGAAEFGEMRLALVAVGVLANVIAPLRVTALAWFGRGTGNDQRRAWVARGLGMVLGLLVLAFGLFIAYMPVGTGTALFGELWMQARQYLVLATFAEALRVAAFPLVDFVKARRSGRALVRARVASSAAIGIAIVAGGALGSVEGGLFGLVIAQGASLGLWMSLSSGPADRDPSCADAPVA